MLNTSNKRKEEKFMNTNTLKKNIKNNNEIEKLINNENKEDE